MTRKRTELKRLSLERGIHEFKPNSGEVQAVKEIEPKKQNKKMNNSERGGSMMTERKSK